jgi:hypothetical protein
MYANRSIVLAACAVALFTVGCSYESREGRTGETTVYGEHGEKLTIAQPKIQDITRGGTETVTINLRRDNFSDPVNVSLSDLPSGIEAVDAPRSTNGDAVEIVLRASEDADLVSNHVVLVSAEGPNGIRATESFRLTVKEKD